MNDNVSFAKKRDCILFRLWLMYVYRPVNYSTKNETVPFLGKGREKRSMGNYSLKVAV